MKLFGFHITSIDWRALCKAAQAEKNEAVVRSYNSLNETQKAEKLNAALLAAAEERNTELDAARAQVAELERQRARPGNMHRAYRHATQALAEIAASATPKANGTVVRICRRAGEDLAISQDLCAGIMGPDAGYTDNAVDIVGRNLAVDDGKQSRGPVPNSVVATSVPPVEE
jgi:hypothetical protein